MKKLLSIFAISALLYACGGEKKAEPETMEDVEEQMDAPAEAEENNMEESSEEGEAMEGDSEGETMEDGEGESDGEDHSDDGSGH